MRQGAVADSVAEQARQYAAVRGAAEDARLPATDQRCYGLPYDAKTALASRTPAGWCLIGWVAADSGANTAVSASTTTRRNLMAQTLLSSCRAMTPSRSRREWMTPHGANIRNQSSSTKKSCGVASYIECPIGPSRDRSRSTARGSCWDRFSSWMRSSYGSGSSRWSGANRDDTPSSALRCVRPRSWRRSWTSDGDAA